MKDGGPAFPTLGDTFMQVADGSYAPKSHYGMQGESGMSLRMWLAAKAMQAWLSNPEAMRQLSAEIDTQGKGDDRTVIINRVIAKRSFLLADAMIEAHKETK